MEVQDTGITPEQVEEPAVATTAEEPEEVEADAEDPSAEPEQRKSKGVQKRIDELVKQREEERRRAERLEAMLERQLSQAQKPEARPEPQPMPETRPKPTRESVEYDEDAYIEALTEWKLEQREAKAIQQYRRQQEEQQRQSLEKSYEQRRAEIVTKGKEKYEDFADVVFSLPVDVMHVGVAQALMETESPSDVAYWLGKNPAEAARIAKLSPMKMAVELGKVETRLSSPPPKPTTTAPPPVNPVGGREPAQKDPNKMTTAEWMAWREKQLAERQ